MFTDSELEEEMYANSQTEEDMYEDTRADTFVRIEQPQNFTEENLKLVSSTANLFDDLIIRISIGEQRANAKDLLDLSDLRYEKGETIVITVKGPGPIGQALDSMEAQFNKFN